MRALALHLAVTLAAALAPALAAAPAPSEDSPYPDGKSMQSFAGLSFWLEVPAGRDPAKDLSLIVGLHGLDASAVDFATWLDPLVSKDFVVCCPKSSGPGWSKPDVEKVKEIVVHLMKLYPIGKGRLHAVGFSNGGQHLVFLVMDPDLPFATACWMGSGFTGGRVPARARKEMAVLALAGSEDPARGAAEKTPDLLAGKVRRAEVQIEEGLGHDIPRGLLPYYYFWLTVMEGRFTPGEDESFDWRYDLRPVREIMSKEDRGALVYFYAETDTENEDARRVEHEVFFDLLVRRFGRQLCPVALDVKRDRDLFESYGLTRTPAIVVLKPDGKVVQTFEGKIDTTALAKALRSVAKDRSMPRR